MGRLRAISNTLSSMKLKEKFDNLGIPNEMHLLDSVDHNFLKANRQQKDSMQLWVSTFVPSHYRK
jgi:S-formylglutathione hydrolase FrmB